MGKLIILLCAITFSCATNIESDMTESLNNQCLFCHAQQQIPNGLIYKRYLMKYSTEKRMEEAIFNYLKNPTKETSIMPPQFFLKFPMKEKLHLDDIELRNGIQLYLETFDIKKHIIIEQ